MSGLATLPAALALLVSLPLAAANRAAGRGAVALVAVLVALAGVGRAVPDGSAAAWVGALLLLVRAGLSWRGAVAPGADPRGGAGWGARRIVGVVVAAVTPMLLLRAGTPGGAAGGATELAALGLGVALLGVLAQRPGRRGATAPSLVGDGLLLAAVGTPTLLAPLCLLVIVVERLGAGAAGADPLAACTATWRAPVVAPAPETVAGEGG